MSSGDQRSFDPGTVLYSRFLSLAPSGDVTCFTPIYILLYYIVLYYTVSYSTMPYFLVLYSINIILYLPHICRCPAVAEAPSPHKSRRLVREAAALRRENYTGRSASLECFSLSMPFQKKIYIYIHIYICIYKCIYMYTYLLTIPT